MGIFIIEDDETMIEILQDVIEDHELGEVLGHSTNATADLDLILSAGADIILVDFLMPGRDGAEIVRELKSRGCGAKFIMISQVSSKDMIGKAYDAGIEFFISKPINIIEVKSVITTVMQQIRNERTISQLRNMFLQELDPVGVTRSQPKPAAFPAEKPKAEPEPVARQEESFQKTVTAILGRIGMSGEKGSADIVDVCVYMHTHGKSMNRESIREICAYFTDAPKSMEQRMRRAIATFQGPKRRFEFWLKEPGEHGRVMIDDYAHHPDELRASITSVRDLYPGRRLGVIFQPHLYTRTRDFAPQFAQALSLADEVYLLPIYPAREQPIPGVTSQIILDGLTCAKKAIIPREKLVESIKSLNFDILLTAGAGDIDRLLPDIRQQLI